jgi:carboxylate-amine ligase
MEERMVSRQRDGFQFGLEAEFLLVDAASYRPLWHPDLKFDTLNAALEAIPVDDFACEGLKTEPPHRKAAPYVVEGYHLPDPQMNPIDLLPKGVEIRTPIASSIDDCLAALKVLHARLQNALADLGYQAVALSFHPTQVHFEGPQNKRRHDFWQWAMEAMLTYGPDVNVSVPEAVARDLDLNDLNEKVNYYAPALTALTLSSPLYDGKPWCIRGRIGKSVRTYHRSATAPAIEVHPDQGRRLEFKPFEMSCSLVDYQNYFLVWLALILDRGLKGRASDQTRIYDLGRVARHGVEAETVRERAGEVLDRAPDVLEAWGFDGSSLNTFRGRLDSGRLPADDIIAAFEREQSVPGTLRHLSKLV